MPNQVRSLGCAAAVDLLLALNAATTLRDLSPLKSLGLHKLKVARARKWAMTLKAERALSDLRRVRSGDA